MGTHADIVHEFAAAANARDVDALLRLFHPECEVAFFGPVPEPGPFRGREEVRRWMEDFLVPWQAFAIEVLELRETPDGAFTMLRASYTGAGSGVPVEQTDAHVFTVADGKILRWLNYPSRDDGIAAAGIPA